MPNKGKDIQATVEHMTKSVKDGILRVKRDFITGFWESRADALEYQAILLFREAGKLRALAEQTKTLPDEGIEAVWRDMEQRKMVPEDAKMVVEPETPSGKVN